VSATRSASGATGLPPKLLAFLMKLKKKGAKSAKGNEHGVKQPVIR